MNVAVNIALSFLKKYWYIAAIAALIVMLFSTCNSNANLKRSLSTSDSEKKSIMLNVSKLTQEATLSKESFIDVISEKKELQWVIDSLKKNPKVITEVHYIKSSKNYRDTVRINTSNYDGMLFNRANYKSCGLDISFGWFNLDTIGDFNVTKITELAIVSTNERKKLWGRKRLPKWGRRQYEVTVLTQCGDSLITNYKLTKEK